MKSHVLEESPPAISHLHLAFCLIPTYFRGPVLKRRSFSLPPRTTPRVTPVVAAAAAASSASRWRSNGASL